MHPPNKVILTVAQMRTAEQAVIDAGTTVDSLMQRAGQGAAQWIWRIAVGRAVTILCGPGNNGGDGFVIAEILRRSGLSVCVVAPFEPGSAAAVNARTLYSGDVRNAAKNGRSGVFVDCLFGIGLARGLSNDLNALLHKLVASHEYSIALDVPSGVDADDAALLSDVPSFDMTIALGAWKWAHWTMPAAARMGRRQLVDIGLGDTFPQDGLQGQLLAKPAFAPPPPDAQKYSRGLVAVVAGAMPGAAVLSARAAMMAGAGYVKLLSDGQAIATPPDLVVDTRPLAEALSDDRISAVLIGPGLGSDNPACDRLQTVLNLNRQTSVVLDADALNLLASVNWENSLGSGYVMTPHEGELDRLTQIFAIPGPASNISRKLHRATEIQRASGATIIAKGPDTIIAAAQSIRVAPPASTWLSVAGSGDILAGVVASRLAAGAEPLDASSEAVWLHGEAARLAAGPFTATMLADSVADAYARCL